VRRASWLLWLASCLALWVPAAHAGQPVTLPPGLPPPVCVPLGVEVVGNPGLPVCPGMDGSFTWPTTQICPTDRGLTVDAIRARLPREEWQDASKLLCARATWLPGGPSGVYATWALSLRSGDQNLTARFPAGTRFSVALTLGGHRRAEMVYGSMEDPVATFAGARVVIEGAARSMTFPLQYGPGSSCSGPTATERGSFAGALTIADRDAPLGPLDGVVVGTDAASANPPVWDGTGFGAFISGCGDGNPATDDGRYQAFIPQRTLAGMGVGTGLAPVAAELVSVVNDGDVDPAADVDRATRAEAASTGIRLASAQTPDGVTIDYRLSYSSHRLRVKVDRRKLRAAKRCVARKLRPRVRRGAVTCTRKRR
jgi:hypothetical protein